jgi:glycoside/pentoside/hexuronide:cation symporter, GPH family
VYCCQNVFPVYFLIGFLHQMSQPFKWNMMASAADYGEWKTGKRITRLSFSGNLFMLQPDMAVAGVSVALLTIGASLSYLVLLALGYLYKLDVEALGKIQLDLSKRTFDCELNKVEGGAYPAVEPVAAPGRGRAGTNRVSIRVLHWGRARVNDLFGKKKE